MKKINTYHKKIINYKSKSIDSLIGKPIYYIIIIDQRVIWDRYNI